MNEYFLDESININEHHPIFIILTEGITPVVSHAIKGITKDKFTHASISFDPYMREFYSYNIRNHENGLIKETFFGVNKNLKKNIKIGIFVFFVDTNTKNKIMKNFKDFLKNKDNTSFSLSRLFLKIINQGAEKNKYKQVCSSFISSILKDANVHITDSHIKVVSPAELHSGIKNNNTIYPIYYGNILDFDAIKFKQKLDKMYTNDKINSYSNIYSESFLTNYKYEQYVKKMQRKGLKYVSMEDWEKSNNVKKNMKSLLKQKFFKGKDFDKKKAFHTLDNPPEEFEQKILNEEMNPSEVDKSNYYNFNLFGLFNIYTTDENLQTNEVFIKKMRWVKDRLDEISKEANFILKPFDLTLCATFQDLNIFYDNKAPKWVTGFTWGNEVYMKSPNIYKGELYYNIVLHESIHVMLYNNLTIFGKGLTRAREEGYAVFFSTPLDKWLKELNHNGANWYYYENAIDIQEDYLNGGMKLVLKKSIRK